MKDDVLIINADRSKRPPAIPPVAEEVLTCVTVPELVSNLKISAGAPELVLRREIASEEVSFLLE